MPRVDRILLVLLGTLIAAIGIGWLAGVHPLFETVTNVRAQLVPVALIPVIGFLGLQRIAKRLRPHCELKRGLAAGERSEQERQHLPGGAWARRYPRGLLALRRWRMAAVAAIVFGAIAAPMVPYWFARADVLPADRETIRVMQFNVFFDNTEDARVAAHIAEADADVVMLHEPTPEQWDRLRPLLDQHPHHIAHPLAEDQGQLGGGMVMLSKTPLTSMEVDARYSPPDRVTIGATTEIAGELITVIGLHPFASRTDDRKASLRKTQLDGVAETARAVDGPMIILTDLNIAPTSPQYQDFISDLGWRDPHRVVGWKSTWPTWGGPFGIPIDHVFVSNHFDLHDYEIGDGAGSDHLSVVAEISLRDSDAGQE